ncbi:MAG TPA: putative metalloprotease CJM1_0395 family protein [Candidatus Hydrogenedentes bacterium]|nr:putative metalloprotease CJM1_0395 family protein [Candidatus Hydrogenedentota bacterium]
MLQDVSAIAQVRADRYGPDTDKVSGTFGLRERGVKAEAQRAVPGKSDTLSPEEQREIARLREMDRRVRQHEQAHLAAGGAYVRGGAQFTYVRGPDGKMYATGGEVSIDVSPERTPEATIAKMQQVRRAALAPADPSPQDRSVAAAAARAEMDARRKLAEQALEEQRRQAENKPKTSQNNLRRDMPSM